MSQWMGRVGFELEILAGHVLAEVYKGERVFADETSLPSLAPGTGATKKAWLWAYARDDSTFGGNTPPMVAYRFEDSRSRDWYSGTCGAIAASFRLMVTRPTTSWCARTAAMTASGSPGVGHIAGESSMNSMPRAVRRSPPKR